MAAHARGATESAVTPGDRAIGAALASEANPALAAVVSGSLEEEHHRMLGWAIRHGREAAVPALLRLGVDAATQELDGETPLRLAVFAGAVDAVDALIRAGAPVDARNFDGHTALDAAMGLPDRGLRERLTTRLLQAGAALREPVPIEPEEADAMFERAADAMASGDAAGLRALLDEEPSLAHARSARPHRATLLHYCGANGVEEQRQTPAATDPELARLLLDRGADANATCLLYGGGATALGLALSSIHPVRAGSRRRLAEVLLRAGARLDGDCAPGSLSAMAALGDLDDVRQRLDTARASGNAPADATHVQAAFWWACEFGRTAVADVLLDHGADSGAPNGNGQTGLHLAAVGGWLDTVRGWWCAGRRSRSRTPGVGRRSATFSGRRCTTTRLWTTRRLWRPDRGRRGARSTLSRVVADAGRADAVLEAAHRGPPVRLSFTGSPGIDLMFAPTHRHHHDAETPACGSSLP